MATLKLAKWSSQLTYSHLPQECIQAASRSFYNWAGCAVGGSNHPTTAKVVTALHPFFGRPTSTLLGSPGGVGEADASHAALINGIASHVHDYDDTHLETIIHPAGPVASALLAYTESRKHPVSGKEFITALVAGIEAECKVGLAVWPKHYDIGWHITGTTGSIGAAVAVSSIMHLDPETTAHAIGIASTQVTGLREMFGSDTKSFHVGRAAQNGLLAATLAANGFTSSSQALEAKRGWANVVSQANSLDAQMESLARTWEITENSFKPFPCGIVVHPVIDACVQLHQDLDSDPQRPKSFEEIDGVTAEVHPLVLELTGKETPTDGLQAKFSVYHGAAVGLVTGKATPAQYETDVVLSPEVVRVRAKIEVAVNEGFTADEALVRVRLTDGTVLEKHVRNAVGSLQVPMTGAQLEDKFLDQVGLVLGRQEAEVASGACWGMKDSDDVRGLVRSLRS